MFLHERVADGSDAVEYGFSCRRGGPGKGADEVDEGIGSLRTFIEALKPQRHGESFRLGLNGG